MKPDSIKLISNAFIKNKVLLLLTLGIFYSSLLFPCTYTVSLHDTYGDGWNGNAISVSVNGTPVLINITVNSGYDAVFSFDADSSDVITVTYDASGSWDNENEITISGISGVLFTDGMGGATPTGGTFTIVDNCLPPTNTSPCAATPVTVTAMCDMETYSNSGITGTSYADPGCGNFNGGDVWFVAAVSDNGSLNIESEAMTVTDAAFAVYSSPSNSCNDLVLDQCVSNGTGMPAANLTGYAVNQTLWIRFWEEGGDNNGLFNACFEGGMPSCSSSIPASDECNTATMICNLEGYCGNTSASYSEGSNDPSSFCGSIENSSWISFVAGDTEASLYVWTNNCANGDGIQMEIYETTDCVNYASVSECISTGTMGDFSITATGLTVGETYYLMIDGYAGDVCDYVVSAGQGVMTVDAIVVETGSDNASICGGCVHLEASGGTTYQWSPTTGLDNPNISNPTACPSATTSYTVTVTGGDPNCPSNATAITTVTIESPYTATITNTNLTCEGDSNATVTVSLSNLGSLTTFTYSWSTLESTGPTTETTNTIYNLPAGTYSVSINDETGECENVQTVTIDNPSPLLVDLISSPAYCGGSNGSIETTITNGISDFNATWTESSTLATGNSSETTNPFNISNLPIGLYQVDIIDGNGCIGSDTVTIFDSGSISSGFTISNNQCLLNNSFDFTDTSNESGTISYTVVSPSSISTTLNGNPDYTGFIANEAGIWEVTQNITLGACSNSTTLTFEVYPQPIISSTVSPVSCYGNTDGEIHASSTITGTYNMISTTGNFIGSIAANLPANDYQFSVTTIQGCSDTMEVTITQPTLLEGNLTFEDAICTNLGSASVDITGGTEPYEYLWDDINSQTNATAINLYQGAYNCTATDFNGCTVVFNCTIVNHNTFDSELHLVQPVSCFNGNDGLIAATPIGGTDPFFYTWSDDLNNSNSNASHSGLATGNYSVTISDVNGCESTNSIFVPEPTELLITATSEPASCFGYTDGKAWIEAQGGTSPYSYLWSNSVSDSINLNISADNYSATVTDANGCFKKIESISVNEPNEVVLALYYVPTICIGQAAEITMSATSSPFSPYTFYWNGTQSTETIIVSPTETTAYSAQVIDAHGCESLIKNVVVNVNPPISLIATPDRKEICKGETVTVSVVPSGGSQNYTYQLLDGTPLTEPIILNPESSTTYRIIASDDCGSPEAFVDIPITVYQAPIPSFHADVKQGCKPLKVNFIQDTYSHEEGTTYLWDFGDESSSNASLNSSPTHVYNSDGNFHVSLTIKSPFGCVSHQTEYNYIHVFPVPNAKFYAEPSVASILKPLIYFNNQSTGGTIAAWDFNDHQLSSNWSVEHSFKPTPADYNVTLVVSNQFGCSDTSLQRVSIKDEVTMYLPTGFTPDNDGKNERFYAIGHGIVDQDFEMIIYDRWGEVIFVSTDISEGWDGKVKGLDYAKPGVYPYVVKFLDIYGVPHEKMGYINLIR